MLQYDRIDESSSSHECIIFHYWHFLVTNFKFEPEICNDCHDLLQKTMSFNNIKIGSVITEFILVHECRWSLNLIRNADLIEKTGTL